VCVCFRPVMSPHQEPWRCRPFSHRRHCPCFLPLARSTITYKKIKKNTSAGSSINRSPSSPPSVTSPSQFWCMEFPSPWTYNAPAFNAAPTPMVLWIMPLPGSLAPIGYIYDPGSTRDGDGGLLAAASTFFTHQGHQVFLDQCLDLATYSRIKGSRQPSLTWVGFPTTFYPRALTSLTPHHLLLTRMPLVRPSWWRTFLRRRLPPPWV
jgi:hypothetical protein